MTYHLSSSGVYAPCVATKLACRYGSANHITDSAFEQLKQADEDSPKLPQKINSAPESFYSKAEENYKAINQSIASYELLQEKVSVYTNEQIEKNRLTEKAKAVGYDHTPTLWEVDTKVDHFKEDILRRIKELYIEAGVNPTKAGFLVSDIANGKKGDRIYPLVRKKDSRDPEIFEKTNAAFNAAQHDSLLERLNNQHAKFKALRNVVFDIQKDVSEYKKKAVKEIANDPWVYDIPKPSEREVEIKTEEFRKAIRLKKAGVPDSAQVVPVTLVKAENLSVDSEGKINNAWVYLPDGKAEKIVSYQPPKELTYGVSGHLITESGEQVSSFTHYHSYTSNSSGSKTIYVGSKNGQTFAPVDPFIIAASIDSGD